MPAVQAVIVSRDRTARVRSMGGLSVGEVWPCWGDVVAGDIDVDQTAQLADFSDALMSQGGGCSWRVGCSKGR